MANYKVTAADLEAAIGDVYQPTVEAVKPSRSWMLMIAGVVGFVCVIASICFAWHFTNKPKDESFTKLQSTTSTDSSGHHEMLTQIAKSTTKAAIHLHVSGQNHKMSPQWVSGVDQSFTKGGLKLENNHILIPHDGLYFVYSQASYKIICKSSDEDDSSTIHLSYSILWSSLTAPSTKKRYLLSGIKSVCQAITEEQMNEQRVYESIYLGAVFQLYKGDKLSTEATRLENIEEHSSKTFFGVFEL